MKKQLKHQSAASSAGAVNLLVRYLQGRLALLLLALCAAAFGFISLGAFIVQSERSSLVPYLVTVDKQGVVLHQGKLDPHPEIPRQVIAATLCDFVQHVRAVSSDPTVQRAAITAAYAQVREGSAAQRELDSFFRTHNPFSRGEKERVQVVISNVIAQNGSTYQIDWQERSLSELAESSRAMRALISYETAGTSGISPENLLLNPLGIFVSDFVISDLLV